METYFPKYAGFWKRFIAHIIDQFILGMVKSTMLVPLYIMLGLSFIDWNNFDEPELFVSASVSGDSGHGVAIFGALFVFILIAVVFSMLIDWLYYALLESSVKQATLGKMILRIKVTDMLGERISFSRATGRHFGKIISGMILLIGYIMAGFTQHKQALHDMLAGCLVINQDYTIFEEMEKQP